MIIQDALYPKISPQGSVKNPKAELESDVPSSLLDCWTRHLSRGRFVITIAPWRLLTKCFSKCLGFFTNVKGVTNAPAKSTERKNKAINLPIRFYTNL